MDGWFHWQNCSCVRTFLERVRRKIRILKIAPVLRPLEQAWGSSHSSLRQHKNTMATTTPAESAPSSSQHPAAVDPSPNAGDGSNSNMMNHEPYRLNLFQTLQESQQGGAGGGRRTTGGNSSVSASHHHHHHHQFQQDDASYYAAYRKYCTSKISRIVHRTSVRHVLVHSSKYSHTSSSTTTSNEAATTAAGGAGAGPKPTNASSSSHKKKKNAFVPRDLSIVVHVDCLWHLAYQAERAWSNACEIQRSVAARTGTKGSDGKQRRHAIRRLHKAAQWSQQLWELSTKHCDRVSVEECRSYAEYMAGNVALEKRQYRSALRQYRRSRSILVQLALKGAEDDGPDGADNAVDDAHVLAQRDVWTTRADSLLQPLIRFCEYESRGNTEDDDNDKEDEEESSIPRATSSTDQRAPKGGEIWLAFRGRKVALDSYQELAVLYLKLEQQLKGGGGLGGAGASSGLDEDSFLAVSSDLDAAIRLVQAEFKRYESLPDGPAVRAKRDDLATVRHYMEYQKLSLWRKQQERRLAHAQQGGEDGGATTEADLLHVYDTLLQNAVKTADLQQQQQQQGSGTTATVDDDDPLWLETQAHVLRFRAFRCYYLARFHEENQDSADDGSSVGAAKQDQGSAPGLCRAEALFRQAGKLAARAAEEADACDGMEAHVKALEDLQIRIRAALCRVEALRWLEESGAHAVASTHRPLWMRLNDWDHGAGNRWGGGRGRPDNPAVALADNPPLPMAVPCKPSFYDVAWQHLPRDNDVIDEIGSYIASHEPKRGFMEWIRGGSK
jgi:RNA-binding signal recognition particle 68